MPSHFNRPGQLRQISPAAEFNPRTIQTIQNRHTDCTLLYASPKKMKIMTNKLNYLGKIEDKSPAGCGAVLSATGFMVLGANGHWQHHISYKDQDRSQIVTFVDTATKFLVAQT
jgi:hypothetical protein